MFTIANEFLQIKIKSKGAELSSIQKGGLEYFWQADASVWGRHAPVLFPIVGKVVDNTYKHNGKSYTLTQHGFARDAEFELVSQTADSCRFVLKSSEASLEKYPFKFSFYIDYKLENSVVKVSFDVVNEGDETMYFQLGGHPAFNTPLQQGELFEEYEVVFPENELLNTWLINLDKGLIKHEQEQVIHHGGKISLNKYVFDKDALIFKQFHSRRVSLLHQKTQKGVQMYLGTFPYLGIWAPKGAEKFVCLEPWQGHSDFEDFTGELKNKEGIISLEKNQHYNAWYAVEIL